MNLRHAAAFALVGWYLMVPSMMDCVGVAQCRPRPVSKWTIERSFDTAADCQESADRLQQEAIGELTQAAKRWKDGHLLTVPEAASAASGNAQCIASDDPRLKGN